MFLKHYACCSDRKLIEQLNGNLDDQFFCDLHLGFERLTNFKIVSQIRCELSNELDIHSIEKALYQHWKPCIEKPNHIVTDATCYESEVRYPSIQKLLWESVHWMYKQLRIICNVMDVKMIRSKDLTWKSRCLNFSKMRRKTKAKRVSLTRSLLRLLNKFIDFESTLHNYNHIDIDFTDQYYKRVATIQKIYEQQQFHFDTGERIKDSIVSIHKGYLRPIVRAKEVKPVAFGAKVNKIQIGGIGFIEHLDFNAFNEGTRFIYAIEKAKNLTRRRPKLVGADKIYATNKNRKYATSHNLKTDFIPKGRKSKDDLERKKVRKLIAKERATRLEGSFGKEKEHYHLKKIKARTKAKEILWIFMGIHTANALQVGRRMAAKKVE